MEGFVEVDESGLLALASTMAVRQLSRFKVPVREIAALEDRIAGLVADAEESVRGIATVELRTMRETPASELFDRGTAEFVLLCSVYAELGVRIADKIQRARLAEAN